MAETFPTPASISEAAASALGGSTHERTQVPFVAEGVEPTDSPSLAVRMYRQFFAMVRAMALAARGLPFKSAALQVGVLPLHYRTSAGVDAHFEGGTIALAASSTNYVYIDHATNLLAKSTIGWPADVTTFRPIAIYVTGATEIETSDVDADRRDLAIYQTHASSTSPTGTTATAFTIHSDNVGAEVDQQLRFNRGSDDAEDAAIERDAANNRFNVLSQHTTGTECPVSASEFQVGGTKVIDADGAVKAASSVAGDGLAHSGGVLAVDVDDATIEVDGVNGVQLKDSGITVAKLGDTLADKLVQISIADASGASPQAVAIQAKDIQGNNLAEAVVVEVGVYDDADGQTEATNATISVATGTDLSPANSKVKRVKANGSGQISITVTDGLSETVYVCARTTTRSRIMDCADYGTVTIS